MHPKTRVYGTQNGLNTYRYRSCVKCGHKFMTEEAVIGDQVNVDHARYLEEIGETRVPRTTKSLFDD